MFTQKNRTILLVLLLVLPNSSAFAAHKVALVTGATRGIGAALTENLLAKGWTVFGTGRTSESLTTLQEQYLRFIPITADFSNNADIEHVAETIKASGLKLDIIVHNAGTKGSPRTLTQYSCTQIDEVLLVNLLAPMKTTALLADSLAPEARMLFVTSRAATLELKEGLTYCASKAGLNQVAAILRKELPHVAIACVIPGEVDTHIQKVIRDAATFHLHKEFNAAYDNGQLIMPSICADFLAWALCDMPFAQFGATEIPLSIYDEWHHAAWLKNKTDLPAFPF